MNVVDLKSVMQGETVKITHAEYFVNSIVNFCTDFEGDIHDIPEELDNRVIQYMFPSENRLIVNIMSQ